MSTSTVGQNTASAALFPNSAPTSNNNAAASIASSLTGALAGTTGASATSGSPSGTTSSTSNSLPSFGNNFSTFLTLLTTQLQHQDPTAPMDSSQFTNQLVEFSSVEQAIQENSQLGTLISLQQQNQSAAAVSYLGKTVEVSGNSLPLVNSEGQFSYTLQGTAQSASVVITNQSGAEIRTMPLSTASGKQVVTWNGQDDNGNTVPDGVYNFSVVATDAANKPVTSTATFFGPVTQVSTGANNQATLLVGGQSVTLNNIISVDESSGASSSTLGNIAAALNSLVN
ncbi:MAG TPA: flagellar hook capping FlgD N-terminal domain-containing protein [Alphaproteobacteria bacterium]|nr:flagellar hook capping FlgD N-terminal domain-containing protein [Alphaproteobacteria bacterium]